jgi:hypothetical protein
MKKNNIKAEFKKVVALICKERKAILKSIGK